MLCYILRYFYVSVTHVIHASKSSLVIKALTKQNILPRDVNSEKCHVTNNASKHANIKADLISYRLKTP
jgi:hypothetical protein